MSRESTKSADVPTLSKPRTMRLRYLHTNSMQQRTSSEANSSSNPQRNSPNFIELKDSLLLSQELTTAPFPTPDDSTPHLKLRFFKIHFNIILPHILRSSGQFPSFRFPHQNPVSISLLPPKRHKVRSYHSLRFEHPNNTEKGAHIIKHPITKFSPVSR